MSKEMKNQAIKLVQYEHWANEKIHFALTKAETIPPRALELFSHILAVSAIWLARAKGDVEHSKRFDIYTLDECESLNHQMLSEWTGFINTIADGDEAIMNFTLLGKPSRMPVWDFVHHVVLHGNYHRGQIVALLKGNVPELPMTDYVLFALEEGGEGGD